MAKMTMVAGPKSKLNQSQIYELIRTRWGMKNMTGKDIVKLLNAAGALTGPSSRQFISSDLSSVAIYNLGLPRKRAAYTHKKGLDLHATKRNYTAREPKPLDVFKLIQEVVGSNIDNMTQRQIIEVLSKYES